MAIDLEGRVAVITGAGGGLGRAHALLLARYGAKIVVNDLTQTGGASPAEAVVEEIRSAGGDAIANTGNVADPEAMIALVEQAEAQWGRVDLLVNNAGILRDRTFAKMDLEDFRSVIDVHLMGSVNAAKAVWPGMSRRGFGRIVMTTSSSGLYGNFGQSNYSAAKLGLVGLMRTLAQEGQKAGIHVNCLSPSAATRLTGAVMDEDTLARLDPAYVAPAVVALCADAAPNGLILCAGGGHFETAHITLTRGRRIVGEHAAEQLLASLTAVTDRDGEMTPQTGWDQSAWELGSERRASEAAA